jgi:hypothetical protein
MKKAKDMKKSMEKKDDNFPLRLKAAGERNLFGSLPHFFMSRAPGARIMVK